MSGHNQLPFVDDGLLGRDDKGMLGSKLPVSTAPQSCHDYGGLGQPHDPTVYQNHPVLESNSAHPLPILQSQVLLSHSPLGPSSMGHSVNEENCHQDVGYTNDQMVEDPALGFAADGGFFMPTYNIPEELKRIPSGYSVMDTYSVVGDFGRTYHQYKEGKYLFPNDGAEQDRLDFQHAALKVLLGGRLYFAPITNPKHVLDVGTGTGIWAVEFAEQHPESEVLGIDLSAIQPPNAPANCTFIRDDAEEEWVFTQKFDYVHLRLVFSCFSNPRQMMSEAFKSMEPGAWIEYQDPSIAQIGSMDDNIDGTSFQRWGQALIAGSAIALGRDVEVAPRYRQWLREAGFVDVEERRVLWPAGPWSDNPMLKLAGAYMRRNLSDGAFLATWKALRASGLTEDEAQGVIDGAKREIKDDKNRFYMVAFIVYGRKPSNPTEDGGGGNGLSGQV